MEGKRNPALSFIFVTVLIDVIGFGIIIPVTPNLIQHLANCSISQAASYAGLLGAVYAIMQFLFSPVIGGLSDQFGRRPVLLIALFGFGVDYLFQAFAPTLGWLFVGRLLAGITGASITTAMAYISDVSEPEKRAQNFGIVGAAFGLGFIIGPVIGGLVSKWGVKAPFVVAACFSLLNFVYGYFILPESLKLENRRKFDWHRVKPGAAIFNLKRYPQLIGVVSSLFLIYLAAFAVQGTWTFYNKEKFHWDETMIGISLGVVGVMVAIVQGGLIRWAIPKFGQKKSVYIGLTFYMVGFLLFGLATKGWMMFAFTVVYCLGGICGPALQGIISSHVPANEQGEIQGTLTGLNSISAIFGPLIMTGLFAFFTSKSAPIYLPGAPFFLASVLTFFSVLLAYKSLQKSDVKA